MYPTLMAFLVHNTAIVVCRLTIKTG